MLLVNITIAYDGLQTFKPDNKSYTYDYYK